MDSLRRSPKTFPVGSYVLVCLRPAAVTVGAFGFYVG